MRILPHLALAGSILLLSACGGQTSEEHMLAAQQYIQAKNNEAAILELKNAIQKDPQIAAARFELGRLYIEIERFENAEKELTRAMELGHDPVAVLPLLSQAYKQTGASNALVELDHAQAGLPAVEAIKVGYNKLQALLDLNKQTEARELIVELAELDTRSVYKGLVLAFESVLDEDFETAHSKAEVLRAQSPSNEDVLKLLVRLSIKLQKHEQALTVFEQLHRVNPNDAEMRFTHLALLMDMRRFEQAEPIIDELLELNTEHGLLNQFKGIVLVNNEAYVAALLHLDKALANGQDNDIVRLMAGYAEYRTENYLDAIKHLSLLAAKLPAGHPALRILADSQLLLGQSDAAAKILADIDGETERDAELFTRAGYQLIQQGNINQAKTMIAKGSDIGTTPQDLLRVGVLQLSVSDLSGLLKLEQAAEQAPTTSTQQTLALAYLATGELEKAQQLAEQWKQTRPDAVEPHLLAGEVALRQKNIAMAEQNFAKARHLAPEQVEPKLALVALAIAKKQQDEAYESVVSIVNEHPSNANALALYYVLAKPQGETEQALAVGLKNLSANSDSDTLRYTVANMQLAQRQFAQVLETLEPIEPSNQTPVFYWQIKGRALLLLNQQAEALNHFEAWRAIAPYNKDATLGALLILDNKQKYAEGLALTQAFLAGRKDVQIDILEGHFLAVLKQTDAAQKKLASLADEVLALPFVQGIQARIAIQQKRFAEAADYAEVAYSASPNLRNAMLFMAGLEGSEQDEKAFAVIQQYAKERPNDPRAKIILAERMIPRNKLEAISVYEQTLEILPTNIVVLNNLAYLYFEDGQLDKALPLAEKAVELQPKVAETVDTLAQIHIAKDNVKRARVLYDKVINQPVGTDEVVLNYIELLMKMDDVALAKRWAKQRKWLSPQAQAKAQTLVN